MKVKLLIVNLLCVNVLLWPNAFTLLLCSLKPMNNSIDSSTAINNNLCWSAVLPFYLWCAINSFSWQWQCLFKQSWVYLLNKILSQINYDTVCNHITAVIWFPSTRNTSHLRSSDHHNWDTANAVASLSFGTHWVTSELGSYLHMKFSFLLSLCCFPSSASASASTAGSSVMFFIEIRIFISSPVDLVSLHVTQFCTDFLSF